MIKFFRNIRRNLLTNNRFSKYLIYAIGEIVLVVIGILIAIKINTYNTQQNTIKTITNQLENVILEAQGNIDLLDKTLSKSASIIDASKALANTIVEQKELPPKKLSELIGTSFAPVLNYQPNSELLNEMVLSGTIRDLNNEKVKLLLLEFQARLASLKNQESLHAEDQKLCTELLLELGDFKAVMDDTDVSSRYLGLAKSSSRKGNQALLDSKEFENKLLLFMASGIGLESGMYQPFKAYLQTMIDSIKDELDSYD